MLGTNSHLRGRPERGHAGPQEHPLGVPAPSPLQSWGPPDSCVSSSVSGRSVGKQGSGLLPHQASTGPPGHTPACAALSSQQTREQSELPHPWNSSSLPPPEALRCLGRDGSVSQTQGQARESLEARRVLWGQPLKLVTEVSSSCDGLGAARKAGLCSPARRGPRPRWGSAGAAVVCPGVLLLPVLSSLLSAHTPVPALAAPWEGHGWGFGGAAKGLTWNFTSGGRRLRGVHHAGPADELPPVRGGKAQGPAAAPPRHLLRQVGPWVRRGFCGLLSGEPSPGQGPHTSWPCAAASALGPSGLQEEPPEHSLGLGRAWLLAFPGGLWTPPPPGK